MCAETDEELGRSGPSPSISSRPPGRPTVSPKHWTHAAASSEAMDREDAGVPTVSSTESGPKECQPIPLTDFPASVQKKSSRTLERPPITPKRLTLATVSPQAMDREDAGVPSVSSPESGPKERQPIPLSEFPAFVQKNRHSTFFQEEFNDLPEANIYPQTVAKKQINFEKNRYKNILPYDSSRVQLAILNDDPDSDYFNASFIPSFQHPRRYIASQGPNKASMDDFWRMIWQENVATIAMVTNLSEGNKIKCRQYWPETSTTPLLFGDITVELESVEKCSGGSKRSFVLRKGKAKTQRFLNQFHYTKWPDRDVPRNMSSLLDFISEVRKDHEQNNSPLFIHCSAGVGRTGVLITIDSVVSEAKRNKLVDIFGFVSKIRQSRPNMVQTKEQYKFVYEAVLEYLLSENTAIPVNYFTSRLARLQDIDRNSKGRRTGMSVQFESIKILCPDPPASMIRNGTTAENKPKSRYGNSLPSRVNRVMLRSVNTQSSDFINASFVRGNHGRLITTEMPMPNTVADFWVMILDYQPTAIIMLNDDNQRDKSCARYWFDNGMATFGYLSVLTLATTQREGFIQRTLEVSRGDKVRHVVEQYQFLDWPVDVIKQKKSARSLLKLIEEMREVYSTQNESPLVVHCLNGVGRTAVFCTVLECISQILDEDDVNVFQTVKMMRNDRMHFVQTEEEYALIHMLINGYIQTNDYEQLPCADNDEHTYGNLDCAARPAAVESVYELTEIEAGATACPSQTHTEERNASEDGGTQQVQAKTTDGETLYENFAYEF
ncbi:receptor-type tyrosine-protein phosphatase alpha-like [Strongylocentrotus purpuratus]|uniref:protein-tyrosine-phosphatase n=1 Tax=Strongylocentrotus purpuratus TaxID=7668 RepID=A0A7M7PL92_STRPU|nr:receptor-type tyrosine-protein phosphatase alpha-like [Strongylocentrotus purpuratus]